jgi:hypothetical protein
MAGRRPLQLTADTTALIAKINEAGRTITNPKLIERLVADSMRVMLSSYEQKVDSELGKKSGAFRKDVGLATYYDRHGDVIGKINSRAKHAHLVELGSGPRIRKTINPISGKDSVNPPGWTGFMKAFRFAQRTADSGMSAAVEKFNKLFRDVLTERLK